MNDTDAFPYTRPGDLGPAAQREANVSVLDRLAAAHRLAAARGLADPADQERMALSAERTAARIRRHA